MYIGTLLNNVVLDHGYTTLVGLNWISHINNGLDDYYNRQECMWPYLKQSHSGT